jgi:hypothetical protein
MPISWKPEVQADSTGNWNGNSLRFATKAEAEANVRDLAARWFAVRETRVSESDDPVNYKYEDGKLIRLEAAKE